MAGTMTDTLRELWSPGDEAFYSASGEGRAPETGTYTIQRLGTARERLVLLTLVIAALAVGPLCDAYTTAWVSPVLLAPIILVAGLRLRPSGLVVLLAAAATAIGYVAVVDRLQLPVLLVLAIVTWVSTRLSRNRAGVGIRGLRGVQLLADLRDRLTILNKVSNLPAGWGIKTVVRPAQGSLFGGDLIISYRAKNRLELALVDVSGKGEDAASRALMISGAFGGLLGSVPPEEFLPACNTYLLRQLKQGGLVTAIHLSLDLVGGAYTITCAGHPPAARLAPGRGTWKLGSAKGIALGIVPNAQWVREHGSLAKGDALMLFTDGMWNRRDDIDAGIDRLLGQAEILVQQGYGQAGKLVQTLSDRRRDDCALVLIWRS